MTTVQEFDYSKRIQVCFMKHLKIFQKEINPLHNPVCNAIAKRKMKFITWILKAIVTYPNIEFQIIISMIDSVIIIYENKLDKARTGPMTDKAFDAIRNLEWLNLPKSTHRNDSGKV